MQIVESEMALLTAAKDAAISDVETFIKSTHEQLEQRKNDLVNDILHQFNVRQNALLHKQEQLEKANGILNDNIAQAKRITRTADLNKLRPISESLKEVNEETELISYNLDLGENYLAFDSNKGLKGFSNSLCTLGQIYNKGFLPSMIEFKSTSARAGHKTVLTMEVYDHRNDALPVSSDHFSFQVTDPSNTELHNIQCINSTDCTVTFTPQLSGLHKVTGMFLGQELISEKTHIAVSSNKPVLKFGEYGYGNGAFNAPWGIAIDSSDCIYVADVNNKLIQKFSVGGEFLSQFSVAVHDKDHTTCDIALDLNKGLIFCTEILHRDESLNETSKMLVFNLEGELQNTCTLSDGREGFCIELDERGYIILSNLNKHCLVKVDQEGNYLNEIGHLSSPGYIAIDVDGAIIATDELDDCVLIFNSNGTFRHAFGSSGAGNGQLNQPRGVATDGEYILVSEVGNNRVQVFKYDGTFVSMIESIDDPLDGPCGLALTSDGYVYVADTENSCIKKYKYRDVSW